MRLTDAVIARLRPREREYTVWDIRVAGLGVRVRPSGGQSYVLLYEAGGRSSRVSLGRVSTKSIAEARRECLARQAARKPDEDTAPVRAAPLFRDFVEGEWKELCHDRYKPSTRRTAFYLLRGRLLPAVRIEGARPNHPRSDQALVRCRQPHRSGRRQPCAGPSSANHELRGRVRPRREEPRAGHQIQPSAQPHALPVARGDRAFASGPRQPDPEGQPGAGRHHSSSVAHRVPQERDRATALVRSPRRRAHPGRQQDGREKAPPQYPGPTHPRTPAPGRLHERFRVSLAGRSSPPTLPANSMALVSGPSGSRHRGCPPPRPAPYAFLSRATRS